MPCPQRHQAALGATTMKHALVFAALLSVLCAAPRAHAFDEYSAPVQNRYGENGEVVRPEIDADFIEAQSPNCNGNAGSRSASGASMSSRVHG